MKSLIRYFLMIAFSWIALTGNLALRADVLYKNGNPERVGKAKQDAKDKDVVHFTDCDGQNNGDYKRSDGYVVQKANNCGVHKKGKKKSKNN